MTIKELYEELRLMAAQGTLSLTADTQGMENFASIFFMLNVNEIVLDVMPSGIELSENELEITISNAAINLFDQAPTGMMTIVGTDTTDAVITMTAEFSDLTLQTFLDDGIFTVPDYASGMLPASLVFPSNTMEAIGRPKTPESYEVGELTLSCTESENAWEVFPGQNIGFSNLGYKFVGYGQYENADRSNSLRVTGTWNLGGTALDVFVSLPTIGPSITRYWVIGIDQSFSLVNGLSDLVGLLLGYDLFTNLPDGFSKIPDFALNSLAIAFSPDTATLRRIVIEVGTAESWTTAGGFFTLQDAGLKLNMENRSGELDWGIKLEGNFQFLQDEDPAANRVSVLLTRRPYQTNWNLSIVDHLTLPDFSSVKELAIPGTSAEINSLINGLLLPLDVLSETDIWLYEFALNYNSASRTVPNCDVHLKFNNTWNLAYQGTNLLSISVPELNLWFNEPLSSNRSAYGSIAANITVGDYAVALEASRSDAESDWWLSGDFIGEIGLNALIGQILAPLNLQLPSFFENDPAFTNLAAAVNLSNSGFTFQGETADDWKIKLTDNVSLAFSAAVDLQYDSTNTAAPFAGSLITGSTAIPNIGFVCNVSYQFQEDNNVLTLEWNGFTATYQSGQNTISFQCADLTLGYMMTYMYQLVTGNKRFSLPAPWNLLNDISLNGFELVLNLDDNSLSFSYKLDRPLELFFITISSIGLKKTASAVDISLDCTLFGVPGNESWDLVDGSPPEVPNMGSGTFDLAYLGLGQHVSLTTTENITNVQEATEAYKNAFKEPEDEDGNPLEGNSALKFNPNSNWLIGTQLSLMGTVGLSLIFNDPDIYGLLLEVAGEKAGALDGLRFEILYKKITEAIGMYKAELKLPDKMRRIDMGGIELILPVVGCEIYTNGDFRLDLGYPYDGDFSRAMRVQVFPFTGAGGFYVAKLSADTATNVPETDAGVFDPVTEFGLGLDLGLGADVSNGIMKAGLSLTLQGMLDGVVANYTSKDSTVTDNYYWMQGSLGLVGKVYGTIDFKVVRADFDLVAYANIRAIFESYRAIEVYMKAGVNVRLQIRIKLGLFKMNINCSFSTKIEETYVIGEDSIAPWESSSAALLSGPYNALATRRSPRRYVRRAQRLSEKASAKTVPAFNMQRLISADPVATPVLISCQPAVTGSLDGNSANTQLWQQTLLTMQLFEDSTGYGGFSSLAEVVFCWVLSSFINDSGTEGSVLVDKDEFANEVVSIADIDATYTALTLRQGDAESIINYDNLRTLFSDSFYISVWSTNIFDSDSEWDMTVFPMIPDLTMTVPENDPIDFSTYNMVGQDYIDALNAYFASLQAPAETEKPTTCLEDLESIGDTADSTSKSMATFVFEDYFNALAKNSLQAAMDLLDAWPWVFETGGQNSITKIINYVNKFKTSEMANELTVTQFVDANQHVTFSANRTLTIPALEHQVSAGDTLASLASTYATDAGTLASHNADLHNLLQAGTAVTLEGTSYTIAAGQSLNDLATESGMTVEALGTALAGNANLLRSMALIDIPAFTRASATSLSFAGLAELYNLDVAVLAQANAGVVNLYHNNTRLVLPGLNCMPVNTITSTMLSEGMIETLAAQMSRSMLSGERLPSNLSLTGDSELSAAQSDTLYRLTGQQVNISPLISRTNYSFTFRSSGQEDWLDLGPLQLDETYVRQDIKTDTFSVWKELPATSFNAGIQTFGIGALYVDEPVRFTTGNLRSWQAAAGLSLPNGSGSGSSAGTPYSLWGFPASMKTRLSNLASNLPKATVKKVEQAISGQEPIVSTISDFGFATELRLSLQRSVVTSEDGETEKYVYDVLGADVEGTAMLQRLVTHLNASGTGIIDNIYFLFGADQSDGDALGLQSEDREDLSVFLTQTNLSTETNPPGNAASDAEASTSYILNPLQEFVRLLWQASVVRSGGYYLSYENTSNGTGIPDAVFADGDVADITVAIVYTSKAAVYSFMNAVALGTMVNQGSQSVFLETTANSVTYTLQEGDTLTSIADAHYTTVTRLAADVQDEGLNPDTELQLHGGVLTIAAGENLNRVMRRYELETGHFADGADLSRKSEEERIFELETITYAARRADSLASLAARFNLTVEQLAAQNADVADLFRRRRLTFNDQWMERIPVAPNGSIALKMVRNNPGDPLNSGNAFIGNAYNMFSYQFNGNNNFAASNPGLPMSPAMAENANLFTGKWNYNKVIPAYRLAKNKRMVDVTGMPKAEDNPYAGVGDSMTFAIGLRDYFGNETTVNGKTSITTRLGYVDQLIHVGAWPGVGVDYDFVKTDGKITLEVNFNYDASAYQIDTENTREMVEKRLCVDKEVYRTIYYQLSQPDIQVSWEISIDPHTTYMSDKSFLLEMVEAIYKYLEAAEIDNSATPPTLTPFTATIALLSRPTIAELRVALRISRNSNLVASGFTDIEGVSSIATDLVPQQFQANALGDDEYANLTQFATDFEECFAVDGEPTLKIAVGQSHLDPVIGPTGSNIWVVNVGTGGIQYEIDGSNARFFGVPPLSNTLESRESVSVPTYVTGVGVDSDVSVLNTYSAVDLDAWGKDFTEAVAGLLSPDYATQAQLIDLVGGSDYYNSLLELKEGLAAKIASNVTNILESPTPDNGQLASAQEKMRQELLNALDSAYNIDSIVQFPVSLESPFTSGGTTDPPQYYGQVSGSSGDTETLEYSLSTGRFPLTSDASEMNVAFRSRASEDQTSFAMDMRFQQNNIETEINAPDGIEGYKASTWLSFVIPLEEDDIASVEIPLPLRASLVAPGMEEQVAVSQLTRAERRGTETAGDGAAIIEASKAWSYQYTYSALPAPQDRLRTLIEFNREPAESSATAEDLFSALAAFHTLAPAIQTDFAAYLPEITVATATSSTAFVNASAALGAFVELAEGIVEAWTTASSNSKLGTGGSYAWYEYGITETADDNGNLKVALALEASEGATTAIPVVSLEGFTTIPGSTAGVYTFRNTESGDMLSYADGIEIAERTLTVDGLDLLDQQTAWAGVEVLRNEELVDGATTADAFIYQTPMVRFVDKLLPLVDVTTPIDMGSIDNAAGSPRTLAASLEALFDAIFDPAENWEQVIQVGVKFAQTLNADDVLGYAGIPVTFAPPLTITIENGESDFFATLADQLKTWYASGAPAGYDQRFELDLAIYNQAGDQLPLLRYQGLFLQAIDISDL